MALALAGEDTAALDTYSDVIAHRPDLVALRKKVEVETKSFPRQSPAEVVIELHNGTHLSTAVDVGEPAQDVDEQWRRLRRKFHSLVDPICGVDKANACIDQCAAMEKARGLHGLLESATT